MRLNLILEKELINQDKQVFIENLKLFNNFLKENYKQKLIILHPQPKDLVGQNIIILLHANLYRTKKLAEGFIDSINKQNPVTSVVLLRSLFESAGVISLIHKKYNFYKNKKVTYKELQELLSRLYLGSKDKETVPESPDPINVMTLIDSLDYYLKNQYQKHDNRFRKVYDILSELAHPNSFSNFIGNKISRDFQSIDIAKDGSPFPLKTYKLEFFELIIYIYEEIYTRLEQDVLEKETIPFKKYKK